MNRLGALLAVGLMAMAPVYAAAKEAKLWRSLTLDQVREIVADARGVVDDVELTSGGGYLVHASFDGGVPLDFEALTCQGSGGAKACTEYRMIIALKTKDAATARELAIQRDVWFVADGADKDDYLMWRMGFTYGGVTREYLASTLRVFVDIGWDVYKLLHPESGTATGK